MPSGRAVLVNQNGYTAFRVQDLSTAPTNTKQVGDKLGVKVDLAEAYRLQQLYNSIYLEINPNNLPPKQSILDDYDSFEIIRLSYNKVRYLLAYLAERYQATFTAKGQIIPYRRQIGRSTTVQDNEIELQRYPIIQGVYVLYGGSYSKALIVLNRLAEY